MAQKTWKDYIGMGALMVVGLSMCDQTVQNASAGGTAKTAVVGAATAGGAAAGYGCSKVGVKTCLGGGGGGGGGDKGKAKEKEKEQPTAQASPPVTNPPAPEPEPAPAPTPAPDEGGVPVNNGTTPGGIIVPNSAFSGVVPDFGKSLGETPMDTGLGQGLGKPCISVGLGGVAMSEC